MLSSLLLVLALSGAALTVFVEPIEPGRLSGVEADDLQRLLGKKLRRVEPFAPTTDEEGAVARLVVVECIRARQASGRLDGKQGPIMGPTGGVGTARGGEQEYGVAVDSERVVELTVRLTWGDRFAEETSSMRDRSLEDAVETVLERLARSVAKSRD